jgi:hypothetical protein
VRRRPLGPRLDRPGLVGPRAAWPCGWGRAGPLLDLQPLEHSGTLTHSQTQTQPHIFASYLEKVDDLVKALGVETGISKSEVSRICAGPF